MKKRIYKLWFIVLLLLCVYAVFTLKKDVIKLRENENVIQTENSSYIQDNTELFGAVKKDIKHALFLAEDLFRTLRGEESQLPNGAIHEILYPSIGYEEESVSTEAENTWINSQISLKKRILLYVVDGDTLIVSNESGKEEKVRLIGIDTPESVHSDESKNTIWGEYASNHTKELLKETTDIYLEYDMETTDPYNRTLAYVWLSQDTSNLDNMLNAIILKDGYAVDKVFPPNEKYANSFREITENAEKNKEGLWADGNFMDNL